MKWKIETNDMLGGEIREWPTIDLLLYDLANIEVLESVSIVNIWEDGELLSPEYVEKLVAEANS